MTTYTFNPNASTTTYSWNNPSTWAGGVVPNGPDADVVLPTITSTTTGQPMLFRLDLQPYGASYAIRSLSVANNLLVVDGSLSISGELDLLQGSAVEVYHDLYFGTLKLDGGAIVGDGGLIHSPSSITNSNTFTGSVGSFLRFGRFINNGLVDGVVVDTSDGSFTNNGTLSSVTIYGDNGGFTNYADGVLTGGVYKTDDNSQYFRGYMDFKVGGPITTLNATVIGDVGIYNASTNGFDPLQTTLRTIGAQGSLQIGTFDVGASFTVQGRLTVANFTAPQLTIAAGATVNLLNSMTAAIVDNGSITVGLPGLSVITGAITGSGSVVVGPAQSSPPYAPDGTGLELDGAVSTAIVFADQYGSLQLDQPAAFTGTIAPSGFGDVVELVGVDLNAVTGYNYTGDHAGGVLTLTLSGGATQSLRFVGDFTRDSFVLTNVPQPLSNSPPVLAITERPVNIFYGSTFAVDGSRGAQTLIGTGYTNFIDTSLAAGTGTVLVDLKDGTVSRGSMTDAALSNIQGVQLGADPSVVLGLTTGPDLLYGGSGDDRVYNEGGIDYIQGGTGSNQVVGGSGTLVFYGRGGTDVMLGGAGNTFMQAGSTAGSVDRFFGNGGRDFVYGGAGATTLVGGSGTEDLTGGSGVNTLIGSTSAAGFDIVNGTTGTDAFYAGIGTNLFYEGSGLDAFQSNGGTDLIYGGSGTSYVYGGSGTDVITTGAGDQYVKAGTGHTYFNDTAAHLIAGRLDRIDNFAGGMGTDLYLPTAVQGVTSFVAQNGGTAVLTSIAGGTAEIFAASATVATVQAHTHFAL